MIDVNWDDNAKAAVSAYNDWALENDLAIHAFFEHLTSIGPTQKTVTDVEQEGEKWTHELWGDKAYIKISEPDCDGYLLVITEGNGYNLAKMEDLKPIKPTLSESGAIDILMANKHLSFAALLEDYDVVKD